MAEDRKLGGLYVEIMSQGMQKVQADLDSIRHAMDMVPEERQLHIEVIAEKIGKVTEEIKQLEEQLKKTPKDVKIKAQLEYAKQQKTALVAQKTTLEKGGDGAGLKQQEAMFGKLEQARAKDAADASAKASDIKKGIDSIGATAAKSFAVASAGVAGFIRAADPVGVAKLQGTLGAIAVQLGSIFLPILDAVQKALDGVLNYLRNLDDAQKDQIVGWAKIAGAVALAVAIFPKVLSGISLITGAMRLFGITSAFATGGLTALLGLLAAGAGAFAMFGGEGTSVLGGLMDLVKPIMDAFRSFAGVLMSALATAMPALKEIGKALMDAFVAVMPALKATVSVIASAVAGIIKAFAPIIPVIVETLKIIAGAVAAILTALQPVVSALAEVIGAIVGIIAGLIQALLPVFKSFVGLVVQVFESLAPVIASFVSTLAVMIKAVEPIIIMFGKIIAGALVVVLEVASAILQGLQPLFEALANYMESFGDIFSATMELIAPVLEEFMALLEGLRPIFEEVLAAIVDGLQALQPVFVAVFNAMTAALMGIIKALIYVSTLLKNLAKGNITGAMSEARKAVDEFESRVEEKKQEREEKKRQQKDKKDVSTEPEEDKDEAGKQKPGRHTPTAAPKVELIGFAELWRKAQQSSIETPEQKMQQERNRLAQEQLDEDKKQTRILEDIRDKEDGGGFSTFAP